jgi:4-hydroxyphenylpyruvate dioxygenase
MDKSVFCIPTSIVSGDLAEKFRNIAAAGFDGVELSISDVVGSDASLDEIAQMARDAGLAITALGPLAYPKTPMKIVAKVAMARALGASILIVDAHSTTEDILPDLTTLDDVRIALRPTRQSEADVLDLIASLDCPNVGIALNAFDVLGDGSRPARLREIDGARVFHVQLSDGPQTPMMPGQGTLNLAGFLRVLVRAGYDGPWCVTSAQQGHNTIKNGYRALVTLLSDVALTEPRLRGRIPDLPPKVAATGIEFIEFAVDEASRVELAAMLSSMAFRQERRHFSKAATLWRQGAVNIVVNQEAKGHAHHAFCEHGPVVCDMGLRVKNADETVARAKALGSPDFNQAVGVGELSIPAIRGVGGALMHFIDETSDHHRVWDIEFEPVGRTKAHQPAGLRRIDHVAQTMKYEEMQSWLLYYLSTFKMRKSPIVNVADPSGVIYSQALESPEGEVRMNLNGALGQNTMAGSFLAEKSGAGVQHIAFQTDDIFETSAILQRSGFARLQIAPNYYAETQSEFDLDTDLVGKMQSASILYDQDELGAYFQIYGQTIFSGFFFEIVERRNRYAGYGARNAAIRLAAQAKARNKKRSRHD